MPISCARSLSGSTWTRTAYFCAPCTCTCDTPLTIEMRGASRFSAYSSSVDIDSVLDVSASCMMSWSAGFCLRKVGGEGMPAGSSGITSAIAVWTSTAALSIDRARSNCSVTFVLPVPLDEVIESMPAIVVNCRSIGLATDEAIVVGSPPGRPAWIWIVGKSTVGRSLTGSARYATMPNIAMAAMRRLVAIGRRMKSSETFMCVWPRLLPAAPFLSPRLPALPLSLSLPRPPPRRPPPPPWRPSPVAIFVPASRRS